MRKWVIIGMGLVGLATAWGWASGIRLSPASAAALGAPMVMRPRIVREVPTWFGKAVVFEAVDRGTFGVAQLKRTFGFFWSNRGAGTGYFVEPGKPFQAAGFAAGNDRRTQQFAVGVKVADPAIQFISIGSKDPAAEALSRPAELSLSAVQAHPEVYTVAPVVNGYAVLVADEYNASTWTIRAFNTEGTLVADKIPGAEARWLVKPER